MDSEKLAKPLLSPEQARIVGSYGTTEVLPSEALLFSAGDPSPDFFLVLDGEIDLHAGGAPAVHVVTKRAGDFIGELGVLTGQPSFLSARASRPTTVCRVPRDGLRRLMAEEGEVADLIWQAFMERRRRLERSAAGSLLIIGAGDDPRCQRLRAFAQRVGLPHQWVEPDPAIPAPDLPAAMLNGSFLPHADPASLGHALGMSAVAHTEADLAVIGAGPAGLAAAVTAASEGLRVLVVDERGPGGQAGSTSRIENYPGFPSGVSGHDLTFAMSIQALRFGAEFFVPCRVARFRPARSPFDRHLLELSGGEQVTARAVVVATGVAYRQLDVPGWERAAASSIFYSATPLELGACRGAPVVVVGGANSAGQAALFLAQRGCPVTMVVRAASLESRMSTYLVRRIQHHPQICVRLGSAVTALHADEVLETVEVSGPGDQREMVPARALFCFIGATPDAGPFAAVAQTDSGYLSTAGALPLETRVRGVFAAGDIRAGSTKRVTAAVGDGATAVASVHRYLAEVERGRAGL